MKDTTFYPENVNKYGVLNFAFEKNDLDSASETFRAVGYGHSASLWKSLSKRTWTSDSKAFSASKMKIHSRGRSRGRARRLRSEKRA